MGELGLHMHATSSPKQKTPRGLRSVRRAFVAWVSDRNLNQYCTDSLPLTLPLNDSMSKCLVRHPPPRLLAQEVNSWISEVILCYGSSMRLAKFLLLAIWMRIRLRGVVLMLKRRAVLRH